MQTNMILLLLQQSSQLEAEKRRKGEEVSSDPFDSNCITPGTAFMARLGSHLRFFIRRKIAEDPLWQTPTIVFSGVHACAACGIKILLSIS